MTANENQIVVYQSNETVRLKVWLENEVKTKEPPLQSIFYQNKFWDTKSLLIKFIRRAKKELIVIDAYPGVATGALNRKVKRNEERFPGGFMFKLSAEEWDNLKCQIGISSWGGDRQLPYAFTENGIAKSKQKFIESMIKPME